MRDDGRKAGGCATFYAGRTLSQHDVDEFIYDTPDTASVFACAMLPLYLHLSFPPRLELMT